ncbi:MAG: arylsulfatase [Anditalea sp.]
MENKLKILQSNKIHILFITLALLVLPNIQSGIAQKLPNIVVILADDFGVGDIQAHFPENKIPTPFLDKFVSEGLSFTDAHSPSAVCTPTRYGILTGRYSWRTRLQRHVLGSYEPPLINAERLTLPGFLNKNGYRTAAIGKWHLGWMWPGPQQSTMGEYNILSSAQWDFTKPIAEGPVTRGFDYYFGTSVPNFPPYSFIENDRTVGLPTSRKVTSDLDGVLGPMLPGWKMDEILPTITKKATEYIKEKAKKEEPFFLYFSMTSPHEPVAPSKEFKGKSGIAPIADFVMETDWSAGEILKAIDEAGIAENTLVIFTADNGHSKYTGWDELVNAGHYPSGQYRGGKGDIWEGGHRVPFIVRWPGRVSAGSTNDQLLSLTDVFSTCAELVNHQLPPGAGEDSHSFLQALFDKEGFSVRKDIINHSVSGEFAIRQEKWKLVFGAPAGRESNAEDAPESKSNIQLFNLEDDVSETTDLSAENPEVVESLTTLLEEQINKGRSTPGIVQKNDVEVNYRTYPRDRWAGANLESQR